MNAIKISRRHAIKISRKQSRKKGGFNCYKTHVCFHCFRDTAVRSVSGAMARTALPGAQTVRGASLTDSSSAIN